MGSGYVIEHCVSAFPDYCQEQAYRAYIADGVKCMSESIAMHFGGSYLQERYMDMISVAPIQEKSGDEIALDIIRRAGLKVR
jgi:hypothetical protein